MNNSNKELPKKLTEELLDLYRTINRLTLENAELKAQIKTNAEHVLDSCKEKQILHARLRGANDKIEELNMQLQGVTADLKHERSAGSRHENEELISNNQCLMFKLDKLASENQTLKLEVGGLRHDANNSTDHVVEVRHADEVRNIKGKLYCAEDKNKELTQQIEKLYQRIKELERNESE